MYMCRMIWRSSGCRRGSSSQSPDLLLAAKPGYEFTSGTHGSKRRVNGGTHGYLNSDPQMQAIFIAWGDGIRPGVHLGKISNLDVAPTIAALLGIQMSNVTGRPLSKMLRDVSPLHSKH